MKRQVPILPITLRKTHNVLITKVLLVMGQLENSRQIPITILCVCRS